MFKPGDVLEKIRMRVGAGPTAVPVGTIATVVDEPLDMCAYLDECDIMGRTNEGRVGGIDSRNWRKLDGPTSLSALDCIRELGKPAAVGV